MLVDFPRKDEEGNPVGQVRIRVLTQEEQMVCTSAAEAVAREHLKDAKREELGYERLFADAVTVEVLFRACRDPEDVRRTVFPSTKALRQMLTTDECAALFMHYLTAQLELGPIVSRLSNEELDAWIDRLAEGGSAFPFDLLSSDLQKTLLLYMAYQLRSLQMETSSVGSQPEESEASNSLPSDDEDPSAPE